MGELNWSRLLGMADSCNYFVRYVNYRGPNIIVIFYSFQELWNMRLGELEGLKAAQVNTKWYTTKNMRRKNDFEYNSAYFGFPPKRFQSHNSRPKIIITTTFAHPFNVAAQFCIQNEMSESPYKYLLYGLQVFVILLIPNADNTFPNAYCLRNSAGIRQIKHSTTSPTTTTTVIWNEKRKEKGLCVDDETHELSKRDLYPPHHTKRSPPRHFRLVARWRVGQLTFGPFQPAVDGP